MKLAYDWRNPALPIGTIDSGLGGLSVLTEMRKLLPQEDFVFACDCGKAPWGDRPDAWIQKRCETLIEFLENRRIKALVIACNTATAAAVELLRSELPFPIIGIEPAIKPAAKLTREGVVGVLATTRTITSPRIQSLIDRFAKGEKVALMACPGLMDQVEAGDFHSDFTRGLIRSFVDPLLAQGADTLVLGCTHYPFLADEIRKIAGPSVTIIDPAPAVARHLKARLEAEGILASRERPGKESFWCTGDAEKHGRVLQHLWGPEAVMESLDAAWPALLETP